MNARMLKATLVSTVLALGVFAGPAFADYPPAEPPEVDDDVDDKKDEKVEVDDGDEVDEVTQMPVTGADAGALAAGGLGLLALGGVALRRRDPSGTN